MRGDTNTLIAERDRIEKELAPLDEEKVKLEKEHAELAGKAEANAGDTEILAQIKIRTEQVIEAKRKNERLIAEVTERLKEVEENILMLEQSDIV